MRNLRKNTDKNEFHKINDLIKKFDHSLDFERGLVQITRSTYCSYVRVFLNNLLNTGIISSINKINTLSLNDIYQFILSYSQEGKSRSTQCMMIASLRAFFRFLELFDLANSIPSVAHRKSGSLEYLSYEQLQALLGGCNRNTIKGLRDYTILMLLISLGLRRSEISQLTLEDFNWERGEIVIKSKGSVSCMPISQTLGHILVDYLKYARPKCNSINFFTQIQYPFTGLSAQAISEIVRAGLIRAGIETKRKGAHLLRHSFATQLFARGKSLPEISIALRHKTIETTAIYTHIDFDKLRLVALPWPVAQDEVEYE